MARKRRDDYPGAWHHVMHRGARRSPIFKLPADCQGFLDTLEDTCERSGLEVHAYSLMPNHYHLLLRSPLANLSQGMQHLNGTYTRWLNKRHRWDGPVFRGRFHSQLAHREDHLRVLIAYIHLNPFRAGLVPRLSSEAWTSHRAYLGKEDPPAWLHTDFFSDLFGGGRQLHDFAMSLHRKARAYPDDFDPDTGLFKRRGIEPESATVQAREAKKRAARRRHPRFRDPEEVLRRVCALSGVKQKELTKSAMGPGANPARRFAIWALDRSADMTQGQIAERLSVPYNQVTRLLTRIRQTEPTEPVRSWIRDWINNEE